MLAPVTIAIFGGYFANYIGWRALAGLLVLTTCIFAWLWFDIDRDIAKAALRIREIEARVNSSAKEPLLEWETKWGRGGVIGKRLLRRPFVPAASHRKRNSDG
jgi:MFS family permease